MLDRDLPRLVEALVEIWPKLDLTPEINVMFVGFARRSDGRFSPGIFSSYHVDEVIDACREWSIDNPGSTPIWNNGRGWREIRHALYQRLKPGIREPSLIELHRAHYAGWPGWEYPGDAFILECIRRNELTPLQRHVFAELKKFKQYLHEKYANEDFDAQRAKRERAKWEALRDQGIRDLRQSENRTECDASLFADAIPDSVTERQIAEAF